METIGRINSEAKKWIEEIHVQKWALAHDGGHRYRIMTTNLSEVFNSVLKGVRCLPIIALVQLTFYRINSYFAVRHQLGMQRAKSGKNCTPFVDGKSSSNGIKTGRHEVVLFNRATGIFRIKTGSSIANRSKGGNVQVVKLKEHSCSCQKWQIFGFPCSHVMAACQYCSLDYKVFVQNWYSITTYKMTWDPVFHPIPDRAYWPLARETTFLPSGSMKRKAKSRPRSTRFRNEMDIREGHITVTFGCCK
ncbi:hypothetical protein BUALT_Bualt03G0168900 [Buddleja alternifolia]|uniref:SWIM-type domain-containing protein n=1 Tax=Buddleja alternifolia TaxID=168488 RepID=A0AAV6XVL0_9LAMI|nr:hypothetical protein BUALT_Bualt03G0168900 [Buddleja alternifolia]